MRVLTKQNIETRQFVSCFISEKVRKNGGYPHNLTSVLLSRRLQRLELSCDRWELLDCFFQRVANMPSLRTLSVSDDRGTSATREDSICIISPRRSSSSIYDPTIDIISGGMMLDKMTQLTSLSLRRRHWTDRNLLVLPTTLHSLSLDVPVFAANLQELCSLHTLQFHFRDFAELRKFNGNAPAFSKSLACLTDLDICIAVPLSLLVTVSLYLPFPQVRRFKLANQHMRSPDVEIIVVMPFLETLVCRGLLVGEVYHLVKPCLATLCKLELIVHRHTADTKVFDQEAVLPVAADVSLDIPHEHSLPSMPRVTKFSVAAYTSDTVRDIYSAAPLVEDLTIHTNNCPDIAADAFVVASRCKNLKSLSIDCPPPSATLVRTWLMRRRFRALRKFALTGCDSGSCGVSGLGRDDGYGRWLFRVMPFIETLYLKLPPLVYLNQPFVSALADAKFRHLKRIVLQFDTPVLETTETNHLQSAVYATLLAASYPQLLELQLPLPRARWQPHVPSCLRSLPCISLGTLPRSALHSRRLDETIFGT